MQAAKGKGGPTSHRYRPASEYDDATLAQKREYWRNKKREQRARLSERRRKPAVDGQKEKVPYLQVSAGGSSSDSASPPLPPHKNSDSFVSISKSRNTHRVGITDAANNQNEAWLQSVNIKGFQPTSPSVLAPAAEGETASVKCPTARRVSSVVSGSQLSTSSSVPPVTETRITNGSSIKTEPQPCVSMQGRPVPKTPFRAPGPLPSQPMVFLTNITTDMKLASSRVSCKAESKTTTPQSGSKSALVTTQRAGGGAQLSQVSEEEKAAKRREHWRIKKREQRAKLAAQIAKVKARTHSGDGAPQRLTAHKTMTSAGLPSQTFLRGMGQRSCPVRVKVPFMAARHDSDKLQGGSVSVVSPNLQTDLIKAQNSLKNRTMQPVITCDVNFVKKPESQRKPSCLNHSVTRVMTRSKTPRQKFVETQKSFMNLRNLRCKSPSMATVFTTKGMPKTDPNDSPEQVIAKRREYWRIKKREQRAKLSLEVKTRAREKDSLMRRVKRYQQILAELRKTRAHSTGSVLSPASETIGGFIKEDGTLTINLPPGPTYPNTAGGKKQEDVQMTQTQRRAGMTKVGVDPVRANQPPPSLRSNQRKVSFPVQPVTKTPRLLLIKPHLPITTVPRSAATQSLRLFSHSPPPQNVVSVGSASGPVSGSCVMKMAISSSASSLVLSQDAGLTEEQRMAKKREYWRIKKREQRAARAVRLKHSALQVRSSAAFLRRRAQRQELATGVQMSLTKCTENTQPLPNNTAPAMPHANEIKQESMSVSTADLNSPSEQAICPDIKPPTSPPAPLGQQLEPDPSLSADSQATTLLAVASMKKLLEESLSCVAECQTEQLGIQIRMKEEAGELDVKPSLSELFEKIDATPVAADVTLQMKSWEPGSDDLSQKDSSIPKLKNPSLITEMLPSFPTCDEVELFTGEPSSQSLNLTENQTVGASSSPSTSKRLSSNKADHRDCCSPELHHLPATPQDHSEPQQELRQHQIQEQGQSNKPSGLTSLQRKREYWKLMKRQQRARLRARQKERPAAHLYPKNNQVPGLIINTLKDVGQRSNLPVSPVAAVSSTPRVLVVSRTGNPDRSPDTLKVKPPITSREEDRMNFRTNHADGPLHEEWKSRSPEISSAPALCALKPPDNPLSSIYLQPIESPGQTPRFIISPIKSPCASLQSPADLVQSPTKLAPQSTMVPPKPVPGESEENFLRRKREYWRIKKKEQRARKAIRGKEPPQKPVSNNWRSVLPAQDLQDQTGAAQDSGLWLDSSEDSEHLNSVSVDPDRGAFTPSQYSAQVEDESEPLFADYNGYNEDEAPPSEVVWRSRYLMDYDPLNQLLVCMVCGELQYSHSLEGVRAHIDEAHPHTLNLEPRERQQILEAWDEQVSQRERFFTSQLQQHSGVLAESYRN